MIHVCFAVHDPKGTYCKYAGTAMCSIFENTKEQVTIHLLHDETLSEANREKFREMAEGYHQTIQMYEVDAASLEPYKARCGYTTIGALFRLKSPEILPESVEKIIYLDGDVVVHSDIKKLWETDIEDKMMAACLDLGLINGVIQVWGCENGLFPKETYINSGVLILNLKRIRQEISLVNECLDFLNQYPKCNFGDQDALNYVFRNSMYILKKEYNLLTPQYRRKLEKTEPGVYHFAGDMVRFEAPELLDELFLSYFVKTPWGTGNEIRHLYTDTLLNKSYQITAYQKIVSLLRDSRRKLIFVGVNAWLQSLMRVIPVNSEIDFCIDDNKHYQGTVIGGLNVYPMSKLNGEKKGQILLIVSSVNRQQFEYIAAQFTQMGLKEYEDFIDGRLLLLQNQGGYATQDMMVR